MAENTGKKKGFGLSGFLALFRRDASLKVLLRQLKAEMEQKISVLELMRLDAEGLKKEAGVRAYDFWKRGELDQDSLNAFFEGIKGREEMIVKQSRILEAIRERIELLEEKKAGSKDIIMLESAVSDTPPDAPLELLPFACPSCGARFEYLVKFCRICGARMGFLENQPGGAEAVMECAVTEAEVAEVVETEETKAAEAESDVAADTEPKEGAEEVSAPESEWQPPSSLILETERLTLRVMVQEDYEDLCTILKDPKVMYAYEHGFDDGEVQEWMDRMLSRYKKYGFGLWAVILKETGTLIGQCGITMQEGQGKQVLEVGYLFAREFWHKGYAAEAAIACRDYAFESLKAEEVYAIIREGNEASERVAMLNGMKRCGWIIKHYYNMDMPHNLYRITRTEWELRPETDTLSYEQGVIDSFNEMVHAGLKRIAMSHPCKTKEERNHYLSFCNKICAKYGTHWYPEDEAFLTDLFPEELNRDTYNIIFYRVKEDLDAYLALKKRKEKLMAEDRYQEDERYRIAFEFGRLLSYPEESIYRKIRETKTC